MTTKPEKKADELVENTAGKLVRMVEEELSKKRKEVAKLEEGQREELLAETKREEELQAQLKKERALVEKMTVEYSKIEKEIEEKKGKEIEASSMKEEDVKEGRISMAEFFKLGKTRKERLKLSISQAQEELKETLSVVRQINLEILGLERELYKCQNRTLQMAAFPLRNLEKTFTSMADTCNFQLGPLLGEITGAKAKLDQLEHQFHLIEQGQGLSSGYFWNDLTLDQARNVQFDPTLPERHVETLKVRLKELEGEENILINIEWFWKGDLFYVDKPLGSRHYEDQTSMKAGGEEVEER